MVPCTTRGKFRVCVEPIHATFTGKFTGDYELKVLDGAGREVGDLTLHASTLNGGAIMRVASIGVVPEARRGGAGTALYEEALAVSCRSGARLVSDFARSPFAESFWRKQQKKKRATCIKRNPDGGYSSNYFGGAITKVTAEFEQECYAQHSEYTRADACIRARLRSFLKGLPKPRRSTQGVFYWPCAAYGFRRDVCKEGGSLKGLWGYR